jgi:hypothetical protein
MREHFNQLQTQVHGIDVEGLTHNADFVTPETGEVTVLGSSGRTYHYGFYSSDVPGARMNIEQAGVPGNGSPTDVMMLENGFIVDLTITTGQTVTTYAQFMVGGSPIAGGIVKLSAHLDTLNNRAPLHVPVIGGLRLEIMQR